MKSIAIVLLFMACSGFGLTLSLRCKARLKQLRELIRGIEPLRHELIELRTPLKLAGDRLPKGAVRELMQAYAHELAHNPSLAADRALDSQLGLEERELASLHEFLLLIANGGSARIALAFDRLQSELEQCVEDAERKLAGKGRVGATLGLLCGAALSILLL